MSQSEIAPAARAGSTLIGPPVQLVLFPDQQPCSPWVIRLHGTKRHHYDFRLQVCDVLLSFVFYEPPSLNPDRWIVAKLVGEHDPRYLLSERCIPPGMRGEGPTMPVDTGRYVPIVRRYSTYDLEVISQLQEGDLRFRLDGHYLRGAWRLWKVGSGWRFQKMPDEYSSTTRVLKLDRSILTGRSLGEILVTHNVHVASFTPVIPGWLDQVNGVDFSHEKALLSRLETWALGQGWTVSDGHELSQELRARTDVLIRKNGDRVRVGVMPKSRSDQGMVTFEASTLRSADLVFQAKKGKWRLEIGTAPVEDDLESAGYGRLFNLLFNP